MGVWKSHQLNRKGESLAILYVEIDLAKNVFAIHGVDREEGHRPATKAGVAVSEVAGPFGDLPSS